MKPPKLTPKKGHVFVAFFSKEAAEKYGVVIYRDERGQKHACTAVARMPREKAMAWFRGNYKWQDKRLVALVCDDCIGRIEGETETQYITYVYPDGECLEACSEHVPGTPGVFHPYNNFVPTDEEKQELIEIAKQTTGYDALAVLTTPVRRHRRIRLTGNNPFQVHRSYFPKKILDRADSAEFFGYSKEFADHLEEVGAKFRHYFN